MSQMADETSSLFDYLRGLSIPAGDYAVFGSGPLYAHNIIHSCGDIDVLCRAGAWELALEIGEAQYLAEYDVTVASVMDGRITFGLQWGIGNLDVDRLIDEAELIDELPFVPLRYVIEYKKLRNSDKDRRHLAAIERYSKNSTTPL